MKELDSERIRKTNYNDKRRQLRQMSVQHQDRNADQNQRRRHIVQIEIKTKSEWLKDEWRNRQPIVKRHEMLISMQNMQPTLLLLLIWKCCVYYMCMCLYESHSRRVNTSLHCTELVADKRWQARLPTLAHKQSDEMRTDCINLSGLSFKYKNK